MVWRRIAVAAGVALLWAGGAYAASPDDTEPDAPVDTVVDTVVDAPAETLPDDTVPSDTVVIDPATGLPAAVGPLVPVPAGCVGPASPVAVFEGTLVAAVGDTARFRVERLLAGSLKGYLSAQGVDIRYGSETRFLVEGDRYIVGVGSGEGGVLGSTVREPTPLFGGDAVIGAADSDVDCPVLDEPVRTLLADGTALDTGLTAPLNGSGRSLALALLRPLMWAGAALVVRVLLKHLLFAACRGVRSLVER
ncbi:MAG: hypothetical protein ACKPDI_03315 [Actinomycetota bacterium]